MRISARVCVHRSAPCTAEGYVTRLALDSDDQVIGYEFVSLGKMTDFIKKGDTPNDAYNKAIGTYGRFNDAAKYIDPRKE